ncbi:MAG: hypothetical protein M1816_002166 [Peltula sp. TS41687]|nr:MAG: hypothetical protein M1816_002166 [Peltula sp. TS41687]
MSSPQTPEESKSHVPALTLKEMTFDEGTSFRSGVDVDNVSLADVYQAIASQATQSPAEMDPSTHRLIFIRHLDRIEIETDEILQRILRRQAAMIQSMNECVIVAQPSLDEFWTKHFTHLPRLRLWVPGCSLIIRPEAPDINPLALRAPETTMPVRSVTLNPLIRQRPASLDGVGLPPPQKRSKVVPASEGHAFEHVSDPDLIKTHARSKQMTRMLTSEAAMVEVAMAEAATVEADNPPDTGHQDSPVVGGYTQTLVAGDRPFGAPSESHTAHSQVPATSSDGTDTRPDEGSTLRRPTSPEESVKGPSSVVFPSKPQSMPLGSLQSRPISVYSSSGNEDSCAASDDGKAVDEDELVAEAKEEVMDQTEEEATAREYFTNVMQKYVDGATFDHPDEARWRRACALFDMDPQTGRFSKCPPWLLRTPFHYQAYGAYFLLENSTEGRASFLADEMGLGKTATILIALSTAVMLLKKAKMHVNCSERECVGPTPKTRLGCPSAPGAHPALKWSAIFPRSPTLIVVPASAISTWESEIGKSQKNLKVHVAYSFKSPPHWRELAAQSKNGKADYGDMVILTSRESLASQVMRHIRDEKHVSKIPLHRIIVDEAHEVRGTETEFARNLLWLKENGADFWFLSGTPLPQGPKSLELVIRCWASAEVVKRAFLPKLSKYEKALRALDTARATVANTVGQKHEKGKEKIKSAAKNLEEVAQWLAKKLWPVMLQRKGETKFLGRPILDLPPMHQETKRLPFVSPRWARRYAEYYVKVQDEIRAEAAQTPGRATFNIFAHHRLTRIMASLPGLMDVPGRHHVDDILDAVANKGRYISNEKLEHMYKSSAKLQDLVERCKEWEITTDRSKYGVSKEKLVVFADSPVEAYVVYLTLQKKARVAVAFMHMRMPQADRHVLVQKEFQGKGGKAKYDVLVGTYRLMGKVYTMAEARHVVLFSPIWLKSEEDQARFRVQRIGQVRKTHSLRYVADQTIDTLVLRRQMQKEWFDARVLGKVDAKGGSLAPRELLEHIGLRLEKDEDGDKIMGEGEDIREDENVGDIEGTSAIVGRDSE